MRLEGGYKTQTVVQIANVVAALNRRSISFRAFRVYFAALAAVAAREAAARSSAKRTPQPVRYVRDELARLCECRTSAIGKELRSLERAGLLLFSDSSIIFTTTLLPGSESLSLQLVGKRSPKRPVPLPRAVLRFIARSNSAATSRTMLAYCVRGLTLTRSGEVKGVGTVKARWIGEVWGASLRAVRLARAELLSLGFISRDVGSKQWKLNRDGAYFAVNLSFGARSDQAKGRLHVALPTIENCTQIAPPYKDMKTPYGLKDQRTRNGERIGFSKADGEPDIRDVQLADLRSVRRMCCIHEQAAAAGLICAGEAGRLVVLAAAVHAVRVGRKNPPGLFNSILRTGALHYITQADEDHARKALLRSSNLQVKAASQSGQTRIAGHSHPESLWKLCDRIKSFDFHLPSTGEPITQRKTPAGGRVAEQTLRQRRIPTTSG